MMDHVPLAVAHLHGAADRIIYAVGFIGTIVAFIVWMLLRKRKRAPGDRSPIETGTGQDARVKADRSAIRKLWATAYLILIVGAVVAAIGAAELPTHSPILYVGCSILLAGGTLKVSADYRYLSHKRRTGDSSRER